MSIRRPRNSQGGYFAAALGGSVGSMALSALGFYLGVAYVNEFMPSAELEGVIPPVFSGLAGYWIGGVLGCWLGLRWRPYRNAGLTITYLAVLLLLGILVDFFMVPFIQALTLPIMTFQAIVLSCHAFKLGISSDQDGRTTRILQFLTIRFK